MKLRNIIFAMLFSSIIGGAITLGGYKLFLEQPSYQVIDAGAKTVLTNYHRYDTTAAIVPSGLNFITGSNLVRPTVVHVKSTYAVSNARSSNPHSNDPFFRYFFEDPNNQEFQNSEPRQSSGSGVIITKDGYIVTNFHVIENASKIEVVLDDKRKYEAKLVGKDPETDLALLKIEEKDLAFVKFGNSDKVQVGEWVLACGNPFDLTSTITAGIVSAKGRNINLLRTKGANNYAIESFIQTDAAVNPGNSGGALVNLKGELIGINTAIASSTGAYAGYSFAVPVTLVKKVTEDLLNFGEVQRALMGVLIQDVTAELAKEKNLSVIKGVYVGNINESGSAKDAGIEPGDVIIKIDNQVVNSSSELQEAVAQHRPGDKIKVTLIRNDREIVKTVTLKNKKGTFNVVKKTATNLNEDLGVELAELTDTEKQKLGIKAGIKVVKILDGKLKEIGAKEGFIITSIDRVAVKSIAEIAQLLEEKNGGVYIEGIYPNGRRAYYAFGW